MVKTGNYFISAIVRNCQNMLNCIKSVKQKKNIHVLYVIHFPNPEIKVGSVGLGYNCRNSIRYYTGFYKSSISVFKQTTMCNSHKQYSKIHSDTQGESESMVERPWKTSMI